MQDPDGFLPFIRRIAPSRKTELEQPTILIEFKPFPVLDVYALNLRNGENKTRFPERGEHDTVRIKAESSDPEPPEGLGAVTHPHPHEAVVEKAL
jgi:hypothetical protein